MNTLLVASPSTGVRAAAAHLSRLNTNKWFSSAAQRLEEIKILKTGSAQVQTW